MSTILFTVETTLDSIRDIKLYQRKDGYRFSVDALLLFSFVNLKNVERILDLGSGSGIVGILLAKKYPSAKVTLIELQESLYKLSLKNIKLNNLENRVNALNADIKKLASELREFDLVVSNPPFRKPLSGLLNVDEERSFARHELKINLSDILSAASKALRNRGRLFIIYHPLRLSEVFENMRKHTLEPKRMRFVHGKIGLEAKMALIEAVKNGRAGLKVEKPLIIYNEDGSYTDEMKEIYENP